MNNAKTTWHSSTFSLSAMKLLATLSVFATLSCGPKNSVEDNEAPTGPLRPDTRSRLTGGSAGDTDSGLNACRTPLDMGTIIDPRRPGLMQTVLTTQIDSRCSSFPGFRVTFKTRQRLTLVGKVSCRNGNQFNEQICTGMTTDILSTQKNSVAIPVIADESWRPMDIDAVVEFF